MDKKAFNEQEICSKYILPSLVDAGWDVITQIREQVPITKGRVIVRGKMHTRGETRITAANQLQQKLADVVVENALH